MQVQAVPLGSHVVGATDPPGYAGAIRAFGEIAEALADKVERDDLLHMVAATVCRLLGIRRCSVYLRDNDSGLFRGQVGETGGSDDAAIKRTMVGVDADGFTREILESRRPVLISDARSDPRPVRSAMRAWGVRSMLGVPMILRQDVIGLLFLDDDDAAHEFTEAEQGLAAAFANLAAVAITQAEMAMTMRDSLSAVARQNRLLRQASALEDRLSELVLAGAGLTDIAETVAQLTDKPAVVLDRAVRPLASASGARDTAPELDPGIWSHPMIQGAIVDVDPKQPRIVGPFLELGLLNRLFVAPVTIGDTPSGFFLLGEYGSRLSQLDAIVARRAATTIGLAFAVEKRAADAQSRAKEALTRDLLYGTESAASLRRRAEYQGLCLDRPHAVVYLGAFAGDGDVSLSPQAVAAAFMAVLPGDKAFVASVEQGVAVIVQIPDERPLPMTIADLKAAAERAIRHLDAPAGSVFGALSSVCRRCEDLPGGLQTAKQVARCLQTFQTDSETPVLAADDLGVGRLLLTASDRAQADRFVDDAIGPLLGTDDPRVADLLLTLHAFFEESRSMRRTAARIVVHENTVRYRLGRIAELTGLAVTTDAGDQLTTQLALVILRLEGRLPQLPPTADARPASA